MPVFPSPMDTLREAIKQVPSLKYALGIAGMAAASAIVLAFTGDVGNPAVPLGLLFAGMILLFLFSRAVATGVYGSVLIGTILVWAVAAVFLVFLGFFVSVFATGKPCHFAVVLGVDEPSCKWNSQPSGEGVDPDINAVRPQHVESTVNAFTYDATDLVKPGPRFWTRIAPDRWSEKTPEGKETFFKEIKRINYGNCDGVVVERFGNADFQLFIPEKGCPNMDLKFRWNRTSQWLPLPRMYNIS